jgi:hypothetical protein
VKWRDTPDGDGGTWLEVNGGRIDARSPDSQGSRVGILVLGEFEDGFGRRAKFTGSILPRIPRHEPLSFGEDSATLNQIRDARAARNLAA